MKEMSAFDYTAFLSLADSQILVRNDKSDSLMFLFYTIRLKLYLFGEDV